MSIWYKIQTKSLIGFVSEYRHHSSREKVIKGSHTYTPNNSSRSYFNAFHNVVHVHFKIEIEQNFGKAHKCTLNTYAYVSYNSIIGRIPVQLFVRANSIARGVVRRTETIMSWIRIRCYFDEAVRVNYIQSVGSQAGQDSRKSSTRPQLWLICMLLSGRSYVGRLYNVPASW